MLSSDWQERTRLLLGNEGVEKLNKAHVLVAGLGGVGGYVAEQLCRSGVGELTLIDSDTVHPSNRNRQIIATATNENLYKTHEFERRLLAINPQVKLHMITEFISGERTEELLSYAYSVVVDAIDTLTPKVEFLAYAVQKGHVVVSSMGAGGRLDPSKIFIDDISKSHHCKLAYMVRKQLHRQNIFKGITVVYSSEEVPDSAIQLTDGSGNKRTVVGTIAYLPAIFGCFCASAVIQKILSPAGEK